MKLITAAAAAGALLSAAILFKLVSIEAKAISQPPEGQYRGTASPGEHPASFPAEATKGDVRLVLMSAGQNTVFPNEVDQAGAEHEPWAPSAHGVSCFTVTFLVEALGQKPFERKSAPRVQAHSDGKLLQLVGKHGAYQEWFDYQAFPGFLDFTKPKVTDPSRAFILRHVQFGALPDLGPFDLRIEAGFEGRVETFEFKAIRLR